VRENILERLFSTCAHRFSWPRRLETGDYYQVCLQCGAEYRYDWSSMRRVERIEAEGRNGGRAHAPSRSGRRSGKKRSWVPRARRLRWNVPIAYREKGKASTEWLHGTTENISHSGVLLRGEVAIEPETPIEMIFQMPSEVTGQAGSNVLCSGSVARSENGERREGSHLLAVTIAGYEFLLNEETAEIEQSS
jgi:hypothetical protein